MKNLSVIIPCYNSSGSIVRCLDSIGINDNLTVILINDNSKDNTSDIIEDYISQHPDFKCYYKNNEHNLGAGESRNIGLKMVDTDYFMFADADDWFEENAVIKILEAINKINADCITFDAWNFKSNKEKFFKMFYSSKIHEGYINKALAFVYARGCPWGKIYKSSILCNESVKFSNCRINEDLVFTKLAILSCKSIYYIDKPYYIYYDVSTSLTNTTPKEAYYSHYAFNAIKPYAIKAGYSVELGAIYFFEVVYPTIMEECRKGSSISKINEIYDTLNINDQSVSYISGYAIKYRLVLKLIQNKLFWIIRLILKICQY